MNYFLSGIIASITIVFPTSVEAHNRHYRFDRPSYRLVCLDNYCRLKRVRRKHKISKNCVYKPWKDKVICKY